MSRSRVSLLGSWKAMRCRPCHGRAGQASATASCSAGLRPSSMCSSPLTRTSNTSKPRPFSGRSRRPRCPRQPNRNPGTSRPSPSERPRYLITRLTRRPFVGRHGRSRTRGLGTQFRRRRQCDEECEEPVVTATFSDRFRALQSDQSHCPMARRFASVAANLHKVHCGR